MADTPTLAATVSDAAIDLMDQAFLLEAQDRIIIDQITDIKREINAKSISMNVYSKLTKQTTALTDGTDADAEAISVSKKTLTPAEYGNVVTRSLLASLQTGGKVDLAAAQLVARNMAESVNGLGCAAAEATTNIRYQNGVADDASVIDTIQDADLKYAHNKLSRANAEMFEGEAYAAVVHPDVAEDLTGLDGWKDVQKYADAVQVLKNEIGMYQGFRFLKSTGMSVTADTANGGANALYKSIFLGRNAIGKGISLDPGLRITGPFDKLGRLLNIGWYGVFVYGLLYTDAIWSIHSMSDYEAS